MSKYVDDLDEMFADPMEGEPWVEAEVVAQPCKEKDLTAPRVLVRRRRGNLIGIDGADLIPLPGSPAISLFTGCGGCDLGLEAAGFSTVVQHEWNREACQTLIANRPRCFRHAALIQGDIRTTPTAMLLQEAGLRVGEAHLVAGGPPCQGYSLAGHRKEDDPRNNYIFDYMRVVREAQPQFFMFENVPGLCSMKKGWFLQTFLEAAYAAYYEIVYGLVDASEYGVPQYRCRFIAMGTRRDVFEIDGQMASLPRPETFADRDLRLLNATATPLLMPLHDRLARAPGIRYFPDRPVLKPPKPVTRDGRSKTFQNFYDRLAREEPDRLVTEPLESGGL